MNQVVQSPLPLDVNVQLGEALNVTVVDRRQESIAFFNHFNAFQRGQIAAEVWQVGLRALEHAQAGANAARLEDVGKALLEDVQDKLQAHVDAQTKEVEAQLRGFLDPKDGRLMQRLDGLLKDNGELARVLQQHTGPGSKMQSTLLGGDQPAAADAEPDRSGRRRADDQAAGRAGPRREPGRREGCARPDG
jgi:hypothetical protein